MIRWRSVFVAVLASFLLVTTTSSQPNTMTTYVQVQLQPGTGGACKQMVMSGGSLRFVPFIEVSAGQVVRWSTMTSTTAFTVGFKSNLTPFNRAQFSSTTGAAVDSDPAHGTVDTQYPYKSLNIGSTNCNLSVGPLGLIMK